MLKRKTQEHVPSIFSAEIIDIYGGTTDRVLACNPLYRIVHPCFDVSPEINLNHEQPQSSLNKNT